MPTLPVSPRLLSGGSVIEWQLFSTTESFSRGLDKFIDTVRPAPFIGLDIHLRVDGSLDSLALSANDHAVVLNLHESLTNKSTGDCPPEGNLSLILTGQYGRLVGVGMARLAMHVRKELRIHVKGFDISSSFIGGKKQLSPGQLIAQMVDYGADSHSLDMLWNASPADLDDNPERFKSLVLRAWLTARIASAPSCSKSIIQEKEINTSWLHNNTFERLYKMLVEEAQMDAVKPRQAQGEFSEVMQNNDGDMIITNERYKTRVRASNTTRIIMQDDDDNEFVGRADGVDGKRTSIKPFRNLGQAKITRIKVVGKEERTLAERARDDYLAMLLRGVRQLSDPNFPLIEHLFFPDSTTRALFGKQDTSYPSLMTAGVRLNESQRAVVSAMTRACAPFVLVHGPPGTGKTSTISVAVQQWITLNESTWLVAQSNVGVKNIAERLCKDDVPFRLIVSKDFYFEWHEHIYEEKIKDQIIRTDEFPQKSDDVSILFHGVRVILCTLSTLSNSILMSRDVFTLVPLTNLVVDEASQIGIFNYLHVLGQYKALKKVCFFGDPKQLPPYGQEVATTMESIFDVQHLKPHAFFLNTQYRMPDPLGNFISEAVYNSKLRSSHYLKTPSCVAFIDANLGMEEKKGMSYKNTREAQSILHLIKYYYAGTDYCVITPYDAQRSFLQSELKREGFRWDNVFNVDSFQGNEADYILISVVRTESSGFLKSRQRVNVMLTRCKKGMVIVSSQAFLHKPGVRQTLLGELCGHWEMSYGMGETWHSWKDVAEGKAALRGRGSKKFADAEAAGKESSGLPSPQLTSSAKSTCSENPADVTVVRGLRRPPVHQALSIDGTNSLTSASASTIARSSSNPTTNRSAISFTTSEAFPSLRPAMSTNSQRQSWNGKAFSKAHLKPREKTDDLLSQFSSMNIHVNVKRASQKASKELKY